MGIPVVLMQRVQAAILENFSRPSLRRVLAHRFGQELESLVPPLAPFGEQISELLKRAEQSGNLTFLLRCLADERTDIVELTVLYEEVRAHFGYRPPTPDANWGQAATSSATLIQEKDAGPLTPVRSPAPLSGDTLERICTAIRTAFTRDELRRLLRMSMNEDMDSLVPDRSFAHQVFEIVQWTIRQGRLEEFVRCAHAANRGNGDLVIVFSELFAPDEFVEEVAHAHQTLPPVELPKPLHQVFVAYSRSDAEIMRQLREDLSTGGLSVWVDDNDLEPGTVVWQLAVERAIRQARCVIAILSPNAKKSEWVNSEITLAKKRGLPVFPVLAHGDEDDSIPLVLMSVQYVDVRNDWAGEVHRRLLPALRRQLRQGSAGTDINGNTGGYTEGGAVG